MQQQQQIFGTIIIDWWWRINLIIIRWILVQNGKIEETIEDQQQKLMKVEQKPSLKRKTNIDS